MGVWTSGISTIVYNRILNEFFKNSLTRYGMTAYRQGNSTICLNFSTSQISESDKPKFPYVTIIELPGQERGQDLEGISINAGLFTFQIDVVHNDKEYIPKQIMDDIIPIMKSMRFGLNEMPSFNSKPQEYRRTARFSRVIGFNDPI